MDVSSLSSSSKWEKIDEDVGDGVAEEELGINIFRAAMNGKVKIFDKPNLSDKQFFRKSVEKNNILHIAVRYGQKEFIRVLLKKYFAINKNLIIERNSQGNTPLHVAAELQNRGIVMLLYNYLKKSVEGHDDEESPWRAQNTKGNTALHIAILCDNGDVAKFLLKRDPGLALIVNKSKEAPLHLAVTSSQFPWGFDMTTILLRKASSVASWRDAKGLTPLHKAASLNPPSYLMQIIKLIINVCPKSTLVCDFSGKSILHHLIEKLFDCEEIEDLIRLKEIRILTNHQDQDGNMPLHIAANCNNIHMKRSLLSVVRNSDGISAMSTIEQQNLFNEPLKQRTMTDEESSSAYKGHIDFLLKRERTFGREFYASQDSEGSNFLHLLMKRTAEHHYLSSSDDRSKFFNFIESTLSFFPKLVCQRDQRGNTPVHILAQNKDLCKTMADLLESSLLSKLLSIFANAISKIKVRGTKPDSQDLPWVEKNADGNTPLHEAIIANNKVLVLELILHCEESAQIVNNREETPLHLLAGTGSGMEKFTVEEIMKMVNANFEALRLADKDALTPVLRALKAENLHMVVTLLHSVENFGDTEGQTFWHLILKHQSNSFVNSLLQDKTFRKVLEQKDKDGNTPLHLAMKEKCFRFVEHILETWGREQELSEGEQLENDQWLMDLLKIIDNDGLTPIMRALKADNLNLATRLCHLTPEAAKMCDIDGKTIWHLLLKIPSYNPIYVNDLLQIETLRMVLERKDKDENTPLHLAIEEKCFDFAQDLLETWGSEGESSERMGIENNQWLMDLLKVLDKDGLTPIMRALKVNNLDLATRLCLVSPETAKMGDTDGKTIWHILPRHPLYNYENVQELLETEALRELLEQKDKDGNTSLHIAIKGNCFHFVHDLFETCRSVRDSSKGNQWLMDLLRISNNVGETPEDLLADMPTISNELELKLLTDPKMRGIRSSWGISRAQLQNYMNSMNVIAALQTTITFTVAFAVPGGLIQDAGTPILIRSIAFQVFMISDVIALCLSMMVLICLLWMMATKKRESVMIQDFAVSLLLASFVATLMTFMSGVYATIFPVKPWIAITTLVLCSFLMLLVHRLMVTKLLLPLKYATVNFVQMLLGPAARFCTKTIENLRCGRQI